MHHPPTTRREVSKDFPCLICGKDHGCTEFPDGNFICRRNENPSRRDLRGGGWWWPDPRGKDVDTPRSQPRPSTPSAAKASNEWLHKVYSAFIAGLSLSNGHRSHLTGDGWADHEIQGAFQSGLVRSISGPRNNPQRRYLLRDLYAKFGDVLKEVPGFNVWENERGQSFASFRAGSGIVFPVVNRDGQITGLRLRRDHIEEGQKRYHWLSSQKVGGPSPGTPPAFYGPNARLWFITEGEKKAMLSLQRRPGVRDDETFTAVSIPGVTTYGELLPDLTLQNVNRIIIALDEEVKPHKIQLVESSRLAIAHHAAQQGIDVEFLRWDSQYKGIDDAIAGGADLVRVAWNQEPAAEKTDESSPPTTTKSGKSRIKLRRTEAAARITLNTPAEARLQLREMMARVGAAARRHDKKLFIAKVAPGVGKSTIADQIFRAARGITSVYLVGNTANIPADAVDRYLGKARILPDGHTCCSSYATIQSQLEKGVPHDHLCFDPDCTYRKQRRAPENGVLTYAAYQTAQHIRAFREADLTIFDDFAPYQLGFTVGAVSRIDLEEWLRFTSEPAGKKYGECRALVNILREVLRDDDKVPGNCDFGVDYVRRKLNDFAVKLETTIRKALNSARKCLKELGEPIRQRQLSGHEPRIFLRELAAAVAAALKGGPGSRRLFINEAGEWKWYRDLQYGRQRKRRQSGWNQDLEGGPKTGLWLDADADVDAIKAIFPDHQVEVIDLSVLALPDEVHIVQNLSQRWGKIAQETGLGDDDTEQKSNISSGARLVAIAQEDLTEALGRGCAPAEVGFIGHKSFIDNAGLPEEAKRANYYGLRSNNSMKDVRELFVYGTPQVGSAATMELCRAFWGVDVRADKISRPLVYRGKVNDYTADNAEVWANDRLRAMDEYFSVQELRQAIDRARPLNAGPERPLRITYVGQHPLPYVVDEFVGLAVDRTEKPLQRLARMSEALANGEVRWDAGRRGFEGVGISERNARDILKAFPNEIAAARAAGKALDESMTPAVSLAEPIEFRLRPEISVKIVAVTIQDAPTIKSWPPIEPPSTIEPRPPTPTSSPPATTPTSSPPATTQPLIAI